MTSAVFDFKDIRKRMLGDLKKCYKCDDVGYFYVTSMDQINRCHQCLKGRTIVLPNFRDVNSNMVIE